MYLSIIIPAYNEEKNLFVNITKFNEYLSKQSYDYEILIVNDGSTDKTHEIAAKLALQINKLKLINNKINRGKGTAVRQGLLSAKGKYRLFIDADGSTSINHIDQIWGHFNKGYDIVIGSRNTRDAKGAYIELIQTFWKKFFSICGNRIIQKIVVPGIWDTQCGFKAFTQKAAEDIISRTKTNRWAVDVEILALAYLLKYKIAIIPVHWKNFPYSRVRPRDYLFTLVDVFKIKWNLINGRYNYGKHKMS